MSAGEITGAASEERHRHTARQPQSSHARRLRRARVRDAQSRPLRAPRGALRPSLLRLAAMYAGAPRHSLRRARFFVEAVGLDRDLGAAAHRVSSRGRRRDQAGLGSSASVRGRRRKLSHRFHRVGLPARARERPVADAARPELDGRAVVRARAYAVRQLARLLSRRGGFSGAAHDGGGDRMARSTRRAVTIASCSSSTSSIRTSRSIRRSRTPRCTIRRGKVRT